MSHFFDVQVFSSTTAQKQPNFNLVTLFKIQQLKKVKKYIVLNKIIDNFNLII